LKPLVRKAAEPASLKVLTPKTNRLLPAIVALSLAAPCFAQKEAKPKEAAKPAAAAASPSGGKSSRLPDEGLKRAQQAEKFLKANQPQQAVITLTQLDRDFPGHAAVSLRLAQVFDQTDQLGPALFYYRRYASMAGDKALQEANERLLGLELMPQARRGATEFAQKRGETTQPIQTPPPLLQHQVAVAREDGALIPVRSAEELAGLKSGKFPDATPVQLQPAHTPLLLSLNTPVPRTRAGAAPPAPAAAEPVHPPQASAPPGEIVASPTLASTPLRTPMPRAQRTSSVYADATPAAPDADEQLAAAFAKGIPAGPPTPPPSEQLPPDPDTGTAMEPAMPMSSPVVSLSGNSVPPAARTTPPPSTPAPVEAEPTSHRAGTFFSVKPDPTGRTTLRLTNGLPDAVVTFAAVPDGIGQTMNAILAKGESRNVQITPGDYELTINVSTTTYPPITQLDTSFTMRFEPGKQYSRRFTRDTIEHIR